MPLISLLPGLQAQIKHLRQSITPETFKAERLKSLQTRLEHVLDHSRQQI